MRHLNKYVFEKLEVSKYKESFVNKYKSRNSHRSEQTKKFKKFFNDLGEMGGLIVDILKYSCIGSTNKSYKIRSEEPDEIKTKNNNPNTWKAMLEYLFGLHEQDIRTDDILKDPTDGNDNYILALGNLDDDDIKYLCKLGFKKIDKFIDNYDPEVDFRNDNDYKCCQRGLLEAQKDEKCQIAIYFRDLYNNIDNIYEEFFE